VRACVRAWLTKRNTDAAARWQWRLRLAALWVSGQSGEGSLRWPVAVAGIPLAVQVQSKGAPSRGPVAYISAPPTTSTPHNRLHLRPHHTRAPASPRCFFVCPSNTASVQQRAGASFTVVSGQCVCEKKVGSVCVSRCEGLHTAPLSILRVWGGGFAYSGGVKRQWRSTKAAAWW